ncbi:hypothetical protein KH5H1_38750 [Corallococcus caeni]|uniref:hypothetical protein n=1 Tax=Corallococcus caeni TaxID=3082388 RepID=UPI00295748D2|nr:hypothetical protein KH5H1_38750 [Corallococcus sp. KH5-1]
MFKKKIALALGLAMLAGSSTAWAGGQSAYPLVIDSATNRIMGSLGSVRNSANSLESLDIVIQAGNGFTVAVIFAQDSTAAVAICNTSNKDMIEVLKAATSDAFIDVTHDGLGTCTHVEVRNASFLEPK